MTLLVFFHLQNNFSAILNDPLFVRRDRCESGNAKNEMANSPLFVICM